MVNCQYVSTWQGPAIYTTQGSMDYYTRGYAIRVHARPHNALHSPSFYPLASDNLHLVNYCSVKDAILAKQVHVEDFSDI